MKTTNYINSHFSWKVLNILLVMLLFTQCELFEKENEEDEEEELDPVERMEQQLTDGNWKLIKTETYVAPTSALPDGYHSIDNHTESCKQDDCWVFRLDDYEYELNNGSTKCDPDEHEIDDYGYWYVYEGFGGELFLNTASEKEPYYIELDYLISSITNSGMVLRAGNCTSPDSDDEDGCIILTFSKAD